MCSSESKPILVHTVVLIVLSLLGLQYTSAQSSGYSFLDLKPVNLPQSDYFNHILGESRFPLVDIFVSRLKDKSSADSTEEISGWGISVDSGAVVLLGRQSIEEVQAMVRQSLENETVRDRRMARANLYIDANCPMYIVRHLQGQLREMGLSRMYFHIESNKTISQVLPPAGGVPYSNKKKYCFKIEKDWQNAEYRQKAGLELKVAESEKFHVFKAFSASDENPCGRVRWVFDLRLDEKNEISLNGEPKEWEEIKVAIYDALKSNASKTIPILTTSAETEYADYIQLKSKVNEVYNELRNDILAEKFDLEYKSQWEFSQLSHEIKREVNEEAVYLVIDY